MKIGLVLEGGAMRGMYTAGVLDALLGAGINADIVVGVSAGALFGVNYLSRQVGRVLRYSSKYNQDKSYMGLLPLIREGNIVSTEYAYHEVPHRLDPFDDEAFSKSGVPFFAVVTELESGEPEYIEIKSVFEQMDTLRASGSMPFVSRAVEIGGKKYLDGGISDSIPYRWMSEQGCDKIITVLTRDASYRKGPMSKPLAKLFYKKYPRFVARMLERHNEYNASTYELAKWESEGRAFVLRPSKPIEISRTERDPERLRDTYDLGFSDATEKMNALKQYLHNS